MAQNEYNDIDPQETKEWLAALEGVLEADGNERAHYLLETLVERASFAGMDLPYSATTPYVNTIPLSHQSPYPGDTGLEHKIRSYIRWNAIAMVVKAGKNTNVGGHIASFASSATLYEVGQNHFWRGQDGENGGDLIFFQGHSAPGFYARAFLEGRLSEEQLDNYRQEASGKGLSSYPHPWLMPDFWQFPTVSMGLGPLMAIYQARFMRYLQSRGLIEKTDRKVWAFCGDGEMDELESRGAIGLAGREDLNNLVFVINCNLQRLDGPVRGNGKIIQELESEFRGAGWNVIKVIWGHRWDALLARDTEGLLRKRMMECLDGDYQTFKSKDGAYVREFFFNTPELRAMVADMSDQDIWELNRGGHDPAKIFAAYKEAMESDKPTLILAKTIKGYGMGGTAEAQNIAHQAKKMDLAQLKRFRDRFQLPLSDEQVENVEYLKLDKDSKAYEYLMGQRKALEGFIPSRRTKSASLPIPDLQEFSAVTVATKEGREISTTMAFVRILATLLKDKTLGKHIVPIVPDESRTFGMEGMFRQYGIWNPHGQQYTPADAEQLMFYKESKNGQILQEGINEAGGMSDWIAAATSYSVHGVPMIPFFIYYSMFGFQRFGDLAWAAGDQRARGFLLGGTAGRTTLNGEGLQHEDGHSHMYAATIPNCVPYDPTFAYEVAVIVRDGMRRMYQDQEDVYYYITLLNENYAMPELPQGSEEGILKGMYHFSEHKGKKGHVQLMGSGSILMEVIEGAKLLAQDWGVGSDIWSAPSFTLLAREGMEVERYNRLHPVEEAKDAYFTSLLKDREGPVVAATDYMRAFAEQVRAYLPKGKAMTVLGTDGYGRSDTRKALRSFFEVDRHHVVVAALSTLAEEGTIEAEVVKKAIEQYGIETDLAMPTVR
ncbi:pyruvate dehydrogenase (acetyl-transferring), homodimeric type [Suttonella sp. R2A3]|uniref:pyruvate dehydrogenase (acetyl-transferring), homodimeric type n=1 Tax=Suttonella sp. R2A3 TaxID=2908648 RepID=UPI001F3C8590|nr:pyruvate dehydrogenase (acetyl-transferring), homodimeric type [Suttonella sp. R2A3]UJF24696.1 pyruvate dehydrogenase (acetyl-transferring), homodimeric type [Suttonella sp. R2A3]